MLMVVASSRYFGNDVLRRNLLQLLRLDDLAVEAGFPDALAMDDARRHRVG